MILLQLYTVIFAAALAWLNKIPCRKMADFGASIREEKEFHRANAVVKILFGGFVTIQHSKGVVDALLLLFVLLLIMWVVFDAVLGYLLHGKWYYIGNTAKTDKLLIKWLGKKNAGKMKALIVCCIILALNIYLS